MKTSLRTFRLILPILVISTLLTISGSTLAQSPPNASPTGVPASTKAPTIPDTTEVIVLKAQLEVMQSFTDRMIATVYWTLGSLVVVASLLGGFGWFNSRRLHERDIASIRSELKGNLDSEFAKFRRNQEILTNNKLTEINKATTEKVESSLKPIQNATHTISSSISKLTTEVEYNKLQSEAWYWEAREVPANEFTRYVEILRLAITDNDSLRISTCLKRLCDLINGIQLFSTDIPKLTALIDTLPPAHSISATSLREALAKVKTY